MQVAVPRIYILLHTATIYYQHIPAPQIILLVRPRIIINLFLFPGLKRITSQDPKLLSIYSCAQNYKGFIFVPRINTLLPTATMK